MRPLIYIMLLFTVALSAHAAVFPVPIEYDGNEVGLVTIDYQNNEAVAVLASDLAEVMERSLNEEAMSALARYNFVTLEALAEIGFHLQFRPQVMDLTITVAPNLLSRSAIDLQGDVNFSANSVELARWANINNFNFAASHDSRTETNKLSMDWSGALNVGGIRGLNLIWTTGFDYDDGIGQLESRRGPVTLFNDQPSIPLRVSAGDINAASIGHLAGTSMLGVSMTAAYQELQPYTRISPSSIHQLILRERADVEIFVNGRLVDVLRLAPGQYDLQDIPLNEGSNDIEVTVYYASGEIENLVFSQFYNARLLRAGMSNYALSGGRRSEFIGAGGIHYTDESFATGFYERGLTDWLTLGGNAQFHDDGTVLGAQLGLATPLGNLALRHSQSDAFELTGRATSIDWHYRFIGGARGGAPNLRVSYEEFSSFNNQPWFEGFLLDGSRWLASYALYFGQNTELRLNYQDNQFIGEQRRVSKEARLIYRTNRLRLGLGARQGNFGISTSEDYEVFFTVEFNLANRASGRRYAARYDSWYDELQLSIARPGRQAVGDFSYDLLHTEGDPRRVTSLRSGYVGNRFRASSFTNYSDTNGIGRYGLGGQLNTAVGWVDGHFGWGRAGSGPFTVVKSHPSLGKAPVILNENQQGAEAIANARAGALLAGRPRFRQSQVVVDVPEAPLGYDWGGGHYFTSAGAHTGSFIEIGSDAFYSLIGTLVDSEQEPLSLEVARLKGEGIEQVVFTNRAGRFIAEGLRPGTYTITTAQAPVRTYTFTIAETEDMLQRVGQLQPVLDP